MIASTQLNGSAVKRFDSGATRSTDWDAYAFHLLPIEGLEVWAKRMQQGADTHGIDNWRGGVPVSECLRHLWGHLAALSSGQLRGEKALLDHLGAIMSNAGFLARFIATAAERPELIDVPVIRRALIAEGAMREPEK